MEGLIGYISRHFYHIHSKGTPELLIPAIRHHCSYRTRTQQAKGTIIWHHQSGKTEIQIEHRCYLLPLSGSGGCRGCWFLTFVIHRIPGPGCLSGGGTFVYILGNTLGCISICTRCILLSRSWCRETAQSRAWKPRHSTVNKTIY